MQNKTAWIIACLTILAWIIGIAIYPQAQEQIAIHWGFDGTPDAYASKGFLILLPFGIPLVDMIFKIARKTDPKKGNFESFSSSIDTIRIITAALLCGCCFITSLDAYRPGSVNVELFVMLFLGIVICVFGNIMPRIRPNFTIGIRNPWTISSKAIWRATHRMSGWLWFFGGLFLCLSAIIRQNTILSFGILILLAIVPNIYSYILYRHNTIGKEHIHD